MGEKTNDKTNDEASEILELKRDGQVNAENVAEER
jgi:hypothetical protein